MATDFTGQTYGIYPRVSTQKQATEDKAALDAQIAECRRYADQLGMVLDPECVGREAFSGTVTQRPELNALLREMAARRVPNLVIDRADRLTRAGMLAAGQLLTQFTDAGILLHVASYGMTIKDEYEVNLFLNMAFGAQVANTARIRAAMISRREQVKRGRYLRSNRPPYGFQFETVGTVTRLVRDMRDFNGHRPWEVRQRMCRMYLAGASLWKIAEQFTREGVPTGSMIFPNQMRQPVVHWRPVTVRDILRSPLNEGVAISLRTHRDKKRGKRVAVPLDEQITLPAGTVAPDAVILTHAEAELLARRLALGKLQSARNSGRAKFAALRGGMARCGTINAAGERCNATLRVRADARRPTITYVCRTHQVMPHRCRGLNAPAWELDTLVWIELLKLLGTPGELERKAKNQIKLDMAADSPTSRLNRLKRTRADFERKLANLADSVANENNPTTRAVLQQQMNQYSESLRQSDNELVDLQSQADDHERTRAVLADVKAQWHRHSRVALQLDPRRQEDAPAIRRMLQSLGTEVVAWRDENGELKAEVVFALGTQSATPWFDADSGESTILEPPAGGGAPVAGTRAASRARRYSVSAMFPALAVHTPRGRSPAADWSITLLAPRSLKEPIGCRFSSLR
jgi:DNA invertase Pin-like site-specific DNA recombinase